MMVPRFSAMGAVTQCLSLATIASVGKKIGMSPTFSINHVPRYRIRSTTRSTASTGLLLAEFTRKRVAVHVIKIAPRGSITVVSNVSSTLTSNVLPSGATFVTVTTNSPNLGSQGNYIVKPAAKIVKVLRPKKKHSIRVGIDNRYSTALYLCSICQLLVHKDCSWLPSHVNTAHHRHRLKLTWWFEDTFPKIQNNCDLCSDDMEKSHALYYCERERCIYVAHNNCATKHHEAVQDSVDDDDDRIISNQIELQINHFSHQQHVLALINRDHQDNGDDDDDRIITCNGCMRPITESDDFYRCTKQESPCPFFLHTACAQSPKTMPYPFFSDPLKLLTRAPLIGGSFECHMCEMFSQGFVYCNIKEDEYIDLHCTILWKQKPLKHEAHDHNLEFNAKNESTYKCRGCGTSEKKFWFSCRKCDFHLCISCVKLPSIARHRYDNHPLKLTHDSVKNELDEYYCEICEGKRDPKLWFYSCSDCDFDCHPHCILGRYPQVKLGDSYKHPAHPHLVTLVEKRRSEIPCDKRERILPCDKCSKSCEGLVFECSECDINFHQSYDSDPWCKGRC